MANCLIAYGNLADSASYSGGSWLPELPLSNLANPVQGIVARSASASPEATKFIIDVGVDKTSRLIALVNHNISIQGLVRIRASENDPTMTTGVLFDSDWQEAWPAVYDTASLEWEMPNFWSGQYTSDERQGYTWNVIRFAEYGMLARYWLVEIDDPLNSNGFVDIGRIFVGDAWQPTINMSFGAGIQWEDASTVDEAISGAEFFDRRRAYRVARFTINGLEEDEAYARAFDISRRVGVTREVVFVYNPDDTLHALRRQYRGRLRSLSAVENPTLNVFQTVYEIKEML